MNINSEETPSITIDDLIKANYMQMKFAEATIKLLEQIKENEEKLKFFQEQQISQLELQYKQERSTKNGNDV